MYRQPGSEGRLANSPSTNDRQTGGSATNRPNNVVAGKDGSVYRQNGNQVQQNKGGQWQNSSRNSDVTRTQQSRQNGQQRTQSYNNARSGGGSRGGGGGGGRRR
jgi:hypothetical protein